MCPLGAQSHPRCTTTHDPDAKVKKGMAGRCLSCLSHRPYRRGNGDSLYIWNGCSEGLPSSDMKANNSTETIEFWASRARRCTFHLTGFVCMPRGVQPRRGQSSGSVGVVGQMARLSIRCSPDDEQLQWDGGSNHPESRSGGPMTRAISCNLPRHPTGCEGDFHFQGFPSCLGPGTPMSAA